MTNSTPLEKNEVVEFPVGLQRTPPPVLSQEATQYFEEGMAHLRAAIASATLASSMIPAGHGTVSSNP